MRSQAGLDRENGLFVQTAFAQAAPFLIQFGESFNQFAQLPLKKTIAQADFLKNGSFIQGKSTF